MALIPPHLTETTTAKKNDKPVTGQGSGGDTSGSPGTSQGQIVPEKFGKYFRQRGEALNPVWGRRQVGKMYIDCTFRLSESRRGVLGRDAMPGAVMYVDLQFMQPSEYRLSAAEVEITLLEVDQALSQVGKGKWKGKGKGKGPTDHSDEKSSVSHLEVIEFGPSRLLGEPTSVDETRNKDINPKVAASGINVEVGGWSKEKKVTSVRQWIVRGSKKPSIIEDSWGREILSSSARTLLWSLEENPEDPQARQKAVVHAGFAFRHDGRPVCIKVRVDGTLKSLSSRIKSIFPPKVFKDREQGTVRALMHPDQELGFLDQLEMEAKDLERKMREKNEDGEKLVSGKKKEESTTRKADMDLTQDADQNTDGTAKETTDAAIPKFETTRDDDPGAKNTENTPTAMLQDTHSGSENNARRVNEDPKLTKNQSKQTKSVDEHLLTTTRDVSIPPDAHGGDMELENPEVEKKSPEVREMESTTIFIAAQQQVPGKNGTGSNTLIVGSSILGFILLEALIVLLCQKLYFN